MRLLCPTRSTHLNTPMTDGLAREGMLRAAKSLYRTFTHGDEVAARTDMAIVSLFGASPVDMLYYYTPRDR